MIGAQLGNWTLEIELGRGGMGYVYLAHKSGPPQPDGAQSIEYAAIKVLAAELAKEPGFLHRFQREIDALRQLDHPNIVRFYEAGMQDGFYYYAMEYVAGRNFEELLHERGRLPWREVLAMALQICPALKHAHDHGIIHRDLKPQNLLRAQDGTVKLTDFGIAKVFASKQLTATGGLVGTAEYLSPEQAAGKPVTIRSDLYSFGIVLYALLTGRTPFQGESIVDLLHKHRYAQFDRPQRLVEDIPYEFDEIICRLLEKEPSQRPANALVLQRQLESLQRKLERKERRTIVTAPLEGTKAEEAGLLLEQVEEGGPGTLMSQLMREELAGQKRGGPLARFFNQPWVLVTLLLLCIGIIVWRLVPASKPRPEVLFEQGSQLMTSRDPADWDKAWNEYFEPLERMYPDHPYHKEVEQYRQYRADREGLRRVLAGVNRAAPQGEAERFYQRGLVLCQQGDADRARWVWQHLVRSFRGVESERRWVELAEEGLAQLTDCGPSIEERRQSIRKAFQRVRDLRQAGKQKQADEVWQGLQELYRDDPAARDLLKEMDKAGD